MNTLKLKVLLILTNRHLGWSLSRALVVWFFTCLIGSAIHCAVYATFPLIEAFVLSLIFSSPVLLLVIPTLYLLPSIQSISVRILFSFTSIFIGCALIIGVVSKAFNLDFEMVSEELFAFIPSAVASYFFIARKQILKSSFLKPSINN